MQAGTPPWKPAGFPMATFVRSPQIELVLTCHEALVVVQRRRRRGMAAHEEVVLRPRFCFASECRALFFLCAHCDRGQRYCSLVCRQRSRLRQRRSANRRHQQSPEGRLDHRDRQRQYRERHCRARVTDQGSILIINSASSSRGTVDANSPEQEIPAAIVVFPRGPENRPGLRLFCRVCGCAGRFLDPFPLIPRRR
jgi:hypothetical protein